jgi:hypothetical protein
LNFRHITLKTLVDFFSKTLPSLSSLHSTLRTRKADMQTMLQDRGCLLPVPLITVDFGKRCRATLLSLKRSEGWKLKGYEGGYHRYSTFLFSLLSRLSLSVFAANEIVPPKTRIIRKSYWLELMRSHVYQISSKLRL